MPILILVVGITDAIHLLVRFCDLQSSRGSRQEVLEEVVREIGPPTTVTALTAALGFLSFLAARLPNLQDFGILAAFGVLAAWFTTFTLLPAALLRLGSRVRLRVPPAFALGERLLDAVRGVASRRARIVLLVASVGAIVSLVGIAQIVPDNDASKLLGEGDAIVRADRFVRERLRPLDTIELLYEVGDGPVVTDPAVLGRLEHAEAVLEARLGSGAVISLLPVLRLAHREIVDGSLRLPEDPRTAAQLLLLAEAADAATVRRLVTPDRRMTRLSAGYAWAGGRGMQEDLAHLRGELESALGEFGNWFLTGSISLAVHLGELVLEGQIASFSTALITIFALLFFFVRSASLGILGMAPNVYPVALILAFMGFAGINLDVGTAMIASVLLGVSVDDTVYFLLHYQRSRRGGAGPADAVAYTFAIAGKPALFTAASLALGFFVLAFSSFQSLAIFGLLSGVAVLLAAATELVLMPAVLRFAAGGFKRA
jgi:predicted RND superfamily exporter protein